MPKSRLLKPWSISTTVRSADRVRGFLSVLAQMDGMPWDNAAQKSFQIRLIQARLFGAYRPQFYSNLPQQDVDLIESGRAISYEKAAAIFAKKQYLDPSMRGRQSFKPLQKFGFAALKSKRGKKGKFVHVTEMGRMLLAETEDYGGVFLRALLKWQLPNPLDGEFPAHAGYNIKPFTGILQLIDAVNRLCAESKEKAKGISFHEFEIFGITLINWRNIQKTAGEIMRFRGRLAKIPPRDRERFVADSKKSLRPEFDLKNSHDYADNAIRYFRMTQYICLRGISGNMYIDNDRMRKVELSSLFGWDDARPSVANGDYAGYLASAETPDLPGKSDAELSASIKLMNSEIKKIGGKAAPVSPGKMARAEKEKMLANAENTLQIHIRNAERKRLRNPEEASALVRELRQLEGRYKPADMSAPLKLEQLSAKVLDHILNDAEEIRPNYKVDRNGLPATHAKGGVADIECYYKKFDAICEVTKLTDSKQWVNEAQPVMRHLLDFSKKRKRRQTYCLFIAPKIHKDSLNTFRVAAIGGYEGEFQKIAPMSIAQFCDIADACIDCMRRKQNFSSSHIQRFLEMFSDSVREMKTTDEWMRETPSLIEQWKQAI